MLCRAAERKGSANDIHFVAASGGNAGIACVHAAKLLRCPVTVVVPMSTKPAMVAKLWAMGATAVVQHGASIAEAQDHAEQILLPLGSSGVFVPPFDHPDIWEGNATMMREIADQLGVKPDVVVCSVGGGGLFNGIMQVLDENGWSKEVDVLAMETEGTDSLNQSLRAGRLVSLPKITSQATSLGVVKVAEKAFDNGQRQNVTSIVLSDAQAAQGCCLLADHERLMVELTVGVNVAVCYDGLLQRVLRHRRTFERSSRVVIVVCGGNDICIETLMAWRLAMEDKKSIQETAMGVLVQPDPFKIAARG